MTSALPAILILKLSTPFQYIFSTLAFDLPSIKENYRPLLIWTTTEIQVICLHLGLLCCSKTPYFKKKEILFIHLRARKRERVAHACMTGEGAGREKKAGSPLGG